MSQRFFIPRDTTAVAVGANEVANTLAAVLSEQVSEATIVRNGSRGAFWLEPLMEIETQGERV